MLCMKCVLLHENALSLFIFNLFASCQQDLKSEGINAGNSHVYDCCYETQIDCATRRTKCLSRVSV